MSVWLETSHISWGETLCVRKIYGRRTVWMQVRDSSDSFDLSAYIGA